MGCRESAARLRTWRSGTEQWHTFFPPNDSGDLLGRLPSGLPGFSSRPPTQHSEFGRITAPGLRAESMQPQWPTLTFPNHWSMMTGLQIAKHGIVANHFYDPKQGQQFNIDTAELVGQSQWWKGDPIWSIAERAGVTTANLIWWVLGVRGMT